MTEQEWTTLNNEKIEAEAELERAGVALSLSDATHKQEAREKYYAALKAKNDIDSRIKIANKTEEQKIKSKLSITDDDYFPHLSDGGKIKNNGIHQRFLDEFTAVSDPDSFSVYSYPTPVTTLGETIIIIDKHTKPEGGYDITKNALSIESGSDKNIDKSYGKFNGERNSRKVFSHKTKTMHEISNTKYIPALGKEFDPEDSSSRFFIGETVWNENNNWDGSIVANVGSQDEFLLDDLETENLGSDNIRKAITGSAKNLTNKIGIINDVKKITSRISGNETKTSVPGGTESDSKFSYLKKLKSERYRNVKLNAVNGGTYNSLTNLLGFASGMLVGSLGKSSTSATIDRFTSKFTGGLGVSGLVERLGGAVENLPTAEEIVALNLARFDTMYEARPGRIVNNRYKRFNYITGDTGESFNIKGENDSYNILQKITNKISGVFSTASSWINGSKFTNLLSRKTNNESKIIIDTQRINKEFKVESIISWTAGKTILDKAEDVKDINEESTKAIKKTAIDVFNRINGEFRKIGCLYIEPFYSNGKINCFQIPFEFNPIINDGGYEAKYQTQDLLGRVLAVRSYIGTDSQTVSIETTYLALSPNNVDVPKDDSLNWMKPWTVDNIEIIERLYRSLVMPYIDVDNRKFVRPPIVRIKLRGYNGSDELFGEEGKENDNNIEYVGDLFKYPEKIKDNENVIYVTRNLEGLKSREKRYIVTNLQISPLEDESLSYRYISYNTSNDKNIKKGWRRSGFKVNITLAETTRNFLDIVPTFDQYYKNGDLNNLNTDSYIKDNPSEKKEAVADTKVDLAKLDLDLKGQLLFPEVESVKTPAGNVAKTLFKNKSEILPKVYNTNFIFKV